MGKSLVKSTYKQKKAQTLLGMKTGTYYKIKETLKVHINRKYTGGCHSLGVGWGGGGSCYFMDGVSALYEKVPETGCKTMHLTYPTTDIRQS